MYLPSQFNPRTGEMETDIPRRDILDEIMTNTLATMPLTIMPLMRAGDNGNRKMEFSEPSAEACWIAELVGERVVGEEIDATTDHAWLVVMGYLGQALGLITRLVLAATLFDQPLAELDEQRIVATEKRPRRAS